jgi:hypothetical protein
MNYYWLSFSSSFLEAAGVVAKTGFYKTTERVTDLDYVIMFESILTTFKLSVILRGNWGRSVNWLEPKIEPPKAN